MEGTLGCKSLQKGFRLLTGDHKMIIFNVDLDNTLIYSYKHELCVEKINVEKYQGREVSFLTGVTCENLRRIREKVLFVPTSTRSIEQYNRIDLQIGWIPYALVCNGGVLLADGKIDDAWYAESRKLAEKSRTELEIARNFLEKDARRKFELRFIEELFLFTKCDSSEEIVEELKERIDTSMAGVFCNGEKVYVLPASLSKGRAVQRFRELIQSGRLATAVGGHKGEGGAAIKAERDEGGAAIKAVRDEGGNSARKAAEDESKISVIAAGDSEFDISMLLAADLGIAPHGFRQRYSIDFPVQEMEGEGLFSDELSKRVLELLEQ